MRKLVKQSVGLVHVVLIFGVIVVLGLVTSAVVLGRQPTPARRFQFLCKFFNLKNCPSLPSPSLPVRPSPLVETSPSPESTGSAKPSPSPVGGLSPLTYVEPGGKYSITLPAGWVVNSTVTTTSYSTTKFTGSQGFVAITFGSGKDPIGGCSESSNITLADRTVAGCFLLQKVGSQILTRAYTKDSKGVDFTIEAHINSPLTVNKPAILDVLKSIDIK